VPHYVPNLRDIGGMPATDGAVVKHNIVLRSAMPAIGDRVPEMILWPPALVIDLRSPAESEGTHPLDSRAARIINLPLLSALRPGAAPAEDLIGLYRVMVDFADLRLLELVREVSNATGPTLIHCAAGKDRTGVSVALLLRLVGVSREDVVDDYLASADALDAILARLQKIAGREHRETLPKAFLEVPVEAIVSVLDYWDSHEGGTEGWLDAVGAEAGLTERLRSTLLT
jgi:rhodanese-related sulfurtransferase